MKENPERVIERWNHDREIRALLNCNNRPGHVGAASELVVCVDLMRRGWDVFRSESPQNNFDIVASKGPVMLRIEVRTAAKIKGKLTAATHGYYDILAIVRGFDLLYKPELPEVDL